MAINTDFTHWSRRGDWLADPFEKAAPNVVQGLDYMQDRWPGLTYLGMHLNRKIAGTETMSVHSWGAAGDVGYDPALVPRKLLTDEIFPALIMFSKELGVQAIHDQGRTWRSYRAGDAMGGWKITHTGYGNWFHWETDERSFKIKEPWQKRLERAMGLPSNAHPKPVPVPADHTFLRFDAAEREYGLWPLRDDLPTVKRTTGTVDNFKRDTIMFVQGVILNEAGGNIVVDGQFGRQTDGRVKDLQKMLKLNVDGIVGPNTMRWVQYLAAVGTGDKKCTATHMAVA